MDTVIQATYDRDSRRYHRFVVDEGQEIAGTIYIPKASDGIPESVTVVLITKKLEEE